MKKIILIVIFSLCFTAVGFASGGGKFGRAVTHGGEAKITLRVLDDEQKPVENAMVKAGFYYPSGNQGVISDSTGTNGFCALEGMCQVDMWFQVTKGGYYRTDGRYVFGMVDPPVIKNHWQPWNPTNTVVLKPIKNPVSMYAARVNLGIPEYEKPLGFDLEKGDWVSPYGKGAKSDFIFYAELDQRDQLDFDYKLTVMFPNEKDGIQPLGETSKDGSVFQSDYMAPESGYLSTWKQFRKRKPETAEESNRNKNRIYYFRVGTVLDENGNIISAQYGKIYGDFLQFTYYLNQTPNDRNIEFDPDQNLFGGRDRFAP